MTSLVFVIIESIKFNFTNTRILHGLLHGSKMNRIIVLTLFDFNSLNFNSHNFWLLHDSALSAPAKPECYAATPRCKQEGFRPSSKLSPEILNLIWAEGTGRKPQASVRHNSFIAYFLFDKFLFHL